MENIRKGTFVHKMDILDIIIRTIGLIISAFNAYLNYIELCRKMKKKKTSKKQPPRQS